MFCDQNEVCGKKIVKWLLTWMTLVGVAPRFHILFVTHDKTKLTQTRTAGDARKWWQLCFVRTLATDRAPVVPRLLRSILIKVCSILELSIFAKLWRVKSRFFKNHELYWSNLPQNSNLGRESFVQKSGVQIPVGEGQIFCHFSFFLYLFHFVHKKLNIKT